MQVVVTTCKATKGKLIRSQKFDIVIIDEATQAHEIETLETIFNAKKLFLWEINTSWDLSLEVAHLYLIKCFQD